MTRQCEFKKSMHRNWVKAVLALKLLTEYLQDQASESKRSPTNKQLLPSIFRQHQHGLVRNHCKQKQHGRTYIKKRFQEHSTGRNWLCRWCRCLFESMKSSPFSSDDNSLCMKITETFMLPVSDNNIGSLRSTTCNQAKPNIACQVRQLRNKILLSTNMELEGTTFDNFAGIMISILENRRALANGHEEQDVAEKIAQLKENDLIITNNYEFVANEMVKKSVDERTNEIQEAIDDIIDAVTLNGVCCQLKKTFQESCQCLLKGNDKLRRLKCAVNMLNERLHLFVDDNPKRTEAVSSEIRQHLLHIEKELGTLENVHNLQQRHLAFLKKTGDSCIPDVTCNARRSVFQCEPGCKKSETEQLNYSLKRPTGYTIKYPSNVHVNKPQNSAGTRLMCKPIYPTVDLKSRQVSDNHSLTSSQDTEHCHTCKHDKTEDKSSDIIKEVIQGGSTEFNVSTEIVAVPASEKHSKNGKRKQRINNNVTETDNTLANGSKPTEIHSCEINGTCSNGTQTCIASRKPDSSRSEEVSCDGYRSERSPHTFLTTNPVADCAHSGASNDNAIDSPCSRFSMLKNGRDSLANSTHCKTRAHSDVSNDNAIDSHCSRFSMLSNGRDSLANSTQCNTRAHSDVSNDNANDSSCSRLSMLSNGRYSFANSTHCNTEGDSSCSLRQTSVINNVSSACPTDLPNPEVEHADIQGFEPLMQIIDKIADGQRVPPQITMRYEMLRFCTLRSFPKENKPFITRFAQAGFYYANSGDEVVCYSCARRKSNWREDDNPMEIHRQLNPNCNFLLRNSEVNVPIRISESLLQNRTGSSYLQNLQNGSCTETTSTSNTTPQNTLQNSHQTNIPTSSMNSNTFQMEMHSKAVLGSSLSKDTIPPNRIQSRAHGNFVQELAAGSVSSEQQSHHATVSSSTSDPSRNESLRPASFAQSAAEGINRSATPKYPKYSSKTVRVTSFNDCGDIVIPPDTLADSGFFYAGFGDCVRCFQCGVGLRHWSEEDDPWIEHSRWSKDCAFVRQTKGQEFVNLVQMAVQYSQNQNENDQSPSENVTGTIEDARGGGDIDNLMHTDAAQSVLEMGYHPNIIRRAIRAIREINDGEDLTAANLMEKIFELEEAESSASNHHHGESLEQSQSVAPESIISELPAGGMTTENNTTRSQTPAEVNSHGPSNACLTQSAVREDISSVSTHSGGPETTRTQKKSQLLEQKKLKEENEKLKQQSICTKCRQNDVCIVFLPCGHLVTCETCAPTVRMISSPLPKQEENPGQYSSRLPIHDDVSVPCARREKTGVNRISYKGKTRLNSVCMKRYKYCLESHTSRRRQRRQQRTAKFEYLKADK